MRRTAILVNIARGSVVVEAELVEALQAGTIAGAVLDVFEREPLPAESPLCTMPNVIVTPPTCPATRPTMSGARSTSSTKICRAFSRRRRCAMW